jgi:hypothetical protein
MCFPVFLGKRRVETHRCGHSRGGYQGESWHGLLLSISSRQGSHYRILSIEQALIYIISIRQYEAIGCDILTQTLLEPYK